MFKRKKLEEGQLYFMRFQSSFREYIAVGVNLNKMANNIVARYNTFCYGGDKTTLERLALDALEHDYEFFVSIINVDSACEIEYQEFGYTIHLGDYLEVVRKRAKQNG